MSSDTCFCFFRRREPPEPTRPAPRFPYPTPVRSCGTSATGMACTRDPSTGDNAHYGECLINAQGGDVVAGIRTPQYLTRAARETAGAKAASMEEAMPE